MPIIRTAFLFVFFIFATASAAGDPSLTPAQEPYKKTAYRLSKPLVGEDGRVYACSERNFFAFESNGTIAWSVHLHYTCNGGIAPVHGGKGKVYLVAGNRVLSIEFSDGGSSESATKVFFGPENGHEKQGDIIGLSVSTSLSFVLINLKDRGLFAYMLSGRLLWSAGPVVYQFGYRQGCKKNVTDCYFSSVPQIDLCEASIYIANTEGELYSLSARAPHYKWIQDFSSFDRVFSITPGNNGRLYVTVPVKALVFALDVMTGNVLWQRSVGPLCAAGECAPVVDCNGWISVGSMDGFLYSISPDGDVKKFPRAATRNTVIQVSPLLDCSGYAVYVAQTQMDDMTSHTIGEVTYFSASKPRLVIFTMLVPATGSIYSSESYPGGGFSTLLDDGDLDHFILDEGTLLAFITASKTGNPLPCRTTSQKLMATCSQVKAKHLSMYTGNEKAILLFLFFETILLIVLAVLVRFCWIFWRKKKLQGQNLGNFLEKRRSLQLKKKAFSRTITQIEQKAAEETVSNEMLEDLSNLVRKREGIERKLSTTYSLGRDRAGSVSKSLLPVYDGSFRRSSLRGGSKKESFAIFHTLSDDSSSTTGRSSMERESSSSWTSCEEEDSAMKGKEKEPVEYDGSSSSDGDDEPEPASSSGGFTTTNPLFLQHSRVDEAMAKKQQMHEITALEELREDGGGMKKVLKRRTFSSVSYKH